MQDPDIVKIKLPSQRTTVRLNPLPAHLRRLLQGARPDSPSFTRSHSFTHSLIRPHAHSLTLIHSLTLTHSRSLSANLTHAHSLTIAETLLLSLTHFHSFSFNFTLTLSQPLAHMNPRNKNHYSIGKFCVHEDDSKGPQDLSACPT